MEQLLAIKEKEELLTRKPFRVAIVLPVYNEAASIESTLRELYGKVANNLRFVDIFVFEDGSTDGTKEILMSLQREFSNLHVSMTEKRKGYPRAVRDAFLSVSPQDYQYVMALDSDGQYEPNDFFGILGKMQRFSPDIVMGRRTTRKEAIYRQFLSRCLQLVEKIMFSMQCKDATTVMRLMKTQVAQDLARSVRYSEYNFWLEFTARMSLRKCTVVEIPISYRRRAGNSKVYSLRKMPRVVISEFRALASVRWEQTRRMGLYR